MRINIVEWVLGLACNTPPPNPSRGDDSFSTPSLLLWPFTLGGQGVGRLHTPPSAQDKVAPQALPPSYLPSQLTSIPHASMHIFLAVY